MLREKIFNRIIKHMDILFKALQKNDVEKINREYLITKELMEVMKNDAKDVD